MKNLAFWFNHKKTLFSYFRRHQLGRGKTRRLFFNNRANILLATHIDTVCKPKINRITKKTIFAAGLDDRLGCAIAYQLIKCKHIKADLLICDYEEDGQSTAQYHKLKKAKESGSYNFIIELDRNGIDFVDYYGLAEPQMIEDFKKCTGRKLGLGAFSDICSMESNIGRINVGIGYHKDHAKDSYANIKQVNKALNDVIRFCTEYGDFTYEIDFAQYGRTWDYSGKSMNFSSYSEYAAYSNGRLDYEYNTWVCVHCNAVIDGYPYDPPMCCGEYMQRYNDCYRL